MFTRHTFLFAAVMLGSLPAMAEDRYCREFTEQVQVGGKMVEGYGTACMNPDGSWEVVAEPQPDPSYVQQTVVVREPVYIRQPVYVPRPYSSTSFLSFSFGNYNHGYRYVGWSPGWGRDYRYWDHHDHHDHHDWDRHDRDGHGRDGHGRGGHH